MDPQFRTEEEYLKWQIDLIREDYQKAIEPYIRRLAVIMKPHQIIVRSEVLADARRMIQGSEEIIPRKETN